MNIAAAKAAINELIERRDEYLGVNNMKKVMEIQGRINRLKEQIANALPKQHVVKKSGFKKIDFNKFHE